MANVQGASQTQSKWNLHHFLQHYQYITRPSKFYVKKKKAEITSKWSDFHAVNSLLGFYTTK